MVLLLALPPWLAWGQTPGELLVRMRRAWPDHGSIFLERATTYRIERSPSGFKAERRVEERELMLKDLAGTQADRRVSYSGLASLKDLEAYTLVPSGNGRRKVPVDAISHRDVRDDHVFHDDLRQASFLMPSLVSGAIAVVDHTLSYSDHRLIGGHFFAANRPVEVSRLTIICDPGLEVDVRTFQVTDSLIERSDRMEKGRQIVELVMRRVPASLHEANAPGIRYYIPHAEVLLRPANADSAHDIERLYAWYSTFVESCFAGPHPDIRSLSDSICSGTADPLIKARRIHKWVQDHVHYVAFEDGMNGLVPAPAEKVRQAGYGDCKGMSNLMFQLMRAQDLDAHLCWVGTRELPYRYSDLATASNDDHMIVSLDLMDTTLFLDGTDAQCAFGVPSGFTQGKETLIALSPTRHVIGTVPVMPSSFSTIADSVNARLDGTALVGSGVMHATGYERYRLVRALKGASEARRKEILRNELMKGSNKFLLDSAFVSGTESPDEALSIHYQFRIPDHASIVGNKVYAPLTLNEPWAAHRVRGDRKLPIELHHQGEQRYVVVLNLPASGAVTDPPPPRHEDEGSFSYRLNTSTGEGTVTSTSTFTMNTLLIDSERPAWNRINRALLSDLGRVQVIEIH